ncbi:hypothetical protein IMY05_004G0031900 [Salix suchowensis]|nr:hypothetical protein IMY05_004G0031900 [Salix suchowensis]
MCFNGVGENDIDTHTCLCCSARDEIDSIVTAMQYSVAFSQILITNLCHESQGFTTLSVPAVGSGGGPRCWFLPEPMYNVTDKEVDHSSLFFLWQVLQCRCHRNLDAWSFVF